MKLYFGIFVFLLLNIACKPVQDHSSPVRIVALKGPSAMSLIGLIEKGYQYNGLKASFEIMNEPAMAEALMIHENADLVLIPGNMAAVYYNRGIHYKLLAVPVWGTLFLAGTDRLSNGWESLRGRTVYLMARGATPDIIFRKLLQMHHLEPDADVKLDYSFPNHLELFTAITAGRAPLGVIAEPFLSQAQRINPSVEVAMDLEKDWNQVFRDSIPMAQTALMVSDRFSASNPGWVCAFSRACYNEVDWLHSHLDSASAWCVKYGLAKDTAVARLAVTRANIRYREAMNVRSEIYRYFKILFEFNPASVGGKLPPENMIFDCSSLEK